MRIVRSTILSFIITLALFSNLFAQGSFDVHVGAAIPLNNFSFYQVNYDKSSAVLGWTIGLQYSYRFIEKDFGVFGGIDYIHNGISKEFKETVEYWDSKVTSEQPTFPTYTNVPISVGTNYSYELNENVMLSGDLGLLINFLKMSDYESFGYSYKTDLAIGIGGTVGMSVTLRNRVSFIINYKGLGKHNVDGHLKRNHVPVEEFSQDLSIHLLTLTLGFTF